MKLRSGKSGNIQERERKRTRGKLFSLSTKDPHSFIFVTSLPCLYDFFPFFPLSILCWFWCSDDFVGDNEKLKSFRNKIKKLIKIHSNLNDLRRNFTKFEIHKSQLKAFSHSPMNFTKFYKLKFNSHFLETLKNFIKLSQKFHIVATT